MKTIRLCGDLEKFKPVWTLDVKTPAEALRAISVQREGFLAECDAGHYVAVLVDVADQGRCWQVTGDNALDPWADEELWILPTVGGELPVPLVAAAFAAVGVTVANFTIITMVVNMAISLALSAVANMITGKKKNTPASQQERPENKPSFIADGVVNLTAAGHPHPILFGEVPDCGCMILSSDYWVEDVPV
ncbi:tail assembly protein [Methylomonas sp. MO1]|uniref:tail assembly protein n=1 Tax=unclassified Methylomonas TaxID=2608980 RepID=UPI00047EC631|nr:MULTISPECIES: tail assembly protein [unclassified Methylomonas]MDT4291788.1 tail assembly protein [Methylomonas sp. MO1]